MATLPSHGQAFGIDAGYSLLARTTGFCCLSWDQARIDWKCELAGSDKPSRQEALRSLGLPNSREIAAVAIDGPLRPGLEYERAYRAPEALLSRGRFRTRGKPGPTNGGSGPALHRAATDLAQFSCAHLDLDVGTVSVRACEFNVVEAFPNLFLGVLCDEARYPASPLVRRRWTDTLFPMVRVRLSHILRTLLPGREMRFLEERGHEEIAALTCAITALCVAAQRFVAVGSRNDGYIVLPPEEYWGNAVVGPRPWATVELEASLAGARRRFPEAEILRVIP